MPEQSALVTPTISNKTANENSPGIARVIIFGLSANRCKDVRGHKDVRGQVSKNVRGQVSHSNKNGMLNRGAILCGFPTNQ